MKLVEITVNTNDFLENNPEILNSSIAKNGIVRPDGKVDCDSVFIKIDDVKLFDLVNKKNELRFKYGRVERSFEVRFTDQIKSMKEFPEWVGKQCTLVSLHGIENCEGFPKHVGFVTVLSMLSSLKSIEGMRESQVKDLNIVHCGKLESLKGLPKIIDGNLELRGLVKAKNILEIFNSKGIKKIHFEIGSQFTDKEILDSKEIKRILNKHYQNGRDMIGCQEELIEAGLSEYARLK